MKSIKKRYGIVMLWSLVLCILTAGCRSADGGTSAQEDDVAHSMLQGVWVDMETDMPLMRFDGDSIYYADSKNLPAAFSIVRDSIFFIGRGDTVAYKIERQSENDFWFRSITDHVIRLSRSVSDDDLHSFLPSDTDSNDSMQQRQRTEKDSVVIHDGMRYRGYVFINPSSMKVVRTVVDETGMSVENVFYDNVIHICVYEGSNLLYGQDIMKSMFAGYLQENVLSSLVLSDMNFLGVDGTGYHYQAVLQIPETLVSYTMNLDISTDGQLDISSDES